jgi:hypothetical protein
VERGTTLGLRVDSKRSLHEFQPFLSGGCEMDYMDALILTLESNCQVCQ